MIAAAGGYLEAFKLLIHAGADMNLENKHGQNIKELLEINQNGAEFEKLMVKHAPRKKFDSLVAVYTLHQAAQHGDFDFVHTLISRGQDINAPDADGYTPLMLAARGGHAMVCGLLISFEARCDIVNARHETALLLARKSGTGKDAENVILDELARKLVLGGTHWGKSSKRKVICKKAEVGASDSFRWNRRRKFDTDEPGLFHVVTTKNKELHFVCESGIEMAQLWVRGIKLVTMKAVFGNWQE
ncbi:ankyrin repeat domain-containing protein 17 isoform X2 [Prunus yedoensis var. nudiflora]|uniref:Ankyrin repeat domain-containing protein 17 isoform X2 n=1 Tax=Prunus yedoensis var. nudiflora TaxID=2094558 RepID=A0A314XT74_PRUYE|nr:ankyrin repeat domain-containing protein 17 isoform X2 [Prunus yedoensis var. nudiflora]